MPHDDEFVLPEERDSLQRALKHLYIRAYYSVTIERYYRVCLSIENYERAGGTVEEESVEKLYTARRRVHSYLRQFRAFLDTEDFGAIATREDRYNELIETGHRGGNPTAAGLPLPVRIVGSTGRPGTTVASKPATSGSVPARTAVRVVATRSPTTTRTTIVLGDTHMTNTGTDGSTNGGLILWILNRRETLAENRSERTTGASVGRARP